MLLVKNFSYDDVVSDDPLELFLFFESVPPNHIHSKSTAPERIIHQPIPLYECAVVVVASFFAAVVVGVLVAKVVDVLVALLLPADFCTCVVVIGCVAVVPTSDAPVVIRGCATINLRHEVGLMILPLAFLVRAESI